MSKNHFLTVDAGTGSVRAVLFDLEGNQTACVQQEWDHKEDPRYPGSMDFNWEYNWKLTCGCIKGVLEQSGISPDDIAAISTTCMREGIVLYDKDEHEIWACANVDARASHLAQFAQMGSIYMEHVMGIKNPRVAIVNIGAEEEKGNALVKETFPLLKECKGINFIGSIEAREIPHGGADVIVCEAFVGNVILKLYEGVGATLISMVKGGMMSTLRSKIGALLVKPALKETLKSFDGSQYGGAPLLGLKGLVVKTHGNSKRTEVRNSIIQCVTFKEQDINGKIRQCLDVQNEK